MLLYRSIESVTAGVDSRIVAIGVFDGLHVGHQQLIADVCDMAQAKGAKSAILTFEPMPREHFAVDNPPARLTSFRERFELMRSLGVSEMCCLRFGAIQDLGAQAFVDSLLVERLKATAVVVGDDFRFGAGRAGTIEDLITAGRKRDFAVHQIAPVLQQGSRVSSTAVRQALADGRLADARTMLGRDYAISGRVSRGLALGRTLGFPTANIPLHRKVAALDGIFAVRVAGLGERLLDGVASLGTRPTIGGDRPLLEVYLFDFDADIYGRRIEVRFVSRLRDEQKFSDLGALRQQMLQDAEHARAALSAPIA